MTVDIKKLEDIAKMDNSNFKRYRDLNFLNKKIKYHIKNFLDLKPEQEDWYRDMCRIIAIRNLEELEKNLKIKINPQGNSTATVNLNFSSEIIHESFYEFDTIMIDGKRIIEFFIKFLAVCMNYTPPEKIQNFFKGLKNDLSNSSMFCDALKKNYPKYTEFLKKNWDDWIFELNEYRWKSIHQSIERLIKGSIKAYWDKNSLRNQPKIEMTKMKFHDVDIRDYIKKLESNIDKFYNVGCEFIIDL
jgi:hypothetical protein